MYLVVEGTSIRYVDQVSALLLAPPRQLLAQLLQCIVRAHVTITQGVLFPQRRASVVAYMHNCPLVSMKYRNTDYVNGGSLKIDCLSLKFTAINHDRPLIIFE